ncbi:hypothetical protein KBD34_01110 [Patescibacteria group bacterium]|nr:hypothetical protein [Patescibacteria group bacterium]
MKRFTKRLVPALSLALGTLLVAGSAAAQSWPVDVPPLPTTVTVQAPMVMCPGYTQDRVCQALNAALNPPVVAAPPPRDERAEREERRRLCVTRCGDDDGCKCRCRGTIWNQERGICVSPFSEVEARVTRLTTRVDQHDADFEDVRRNLADIRRTQHLPEWVSPPAAAEAPAPAATPPTPRTSASNERRSRRRARSS